MADSDDLAVQAFAASLLADIARVESKRAGGVAVYLRGMIPDGRATEI